jgi:hypothetical protein
MQTTIELNAADVRRALAAMKEIDKKSVLALRKGLRTSLQPLANQIANESGIERGVSHRGFIHGKATAAAPQMEGKVSFRPGRPLKGGGWTPLLSLQIGTKPSFYRGQYIVELAGSVTQGVTPQGKNLVRILNQDRAMKGRGGRFLYSKFRLLRPDIISRAEKALKPLFEKLGKELG